MPDRLIEPGPFVVKVASVVLLSQDDNFILSKGPL